jgi:hypothetical protein
LEGDEQALKIGADQRIFSAIRNFFYFSQKSVKNETPAKTNQLFNSATFIALCLLWSRIYSNPAGTIETGCLAHHHPTRRSIV